MTCAPDNDRVAAACARSIADGPAAILWDLVGTCNLRCPSCPVGSMTGMNPNGIVDDASFNAILTRLAEEFPGGQLHFYNWTEPLIHPRINIYCRAAAERGFHLHLSSNLNVLRAPEALMDAGVKTIRVSLSGFTQPVYERGHRGGQIDRVKENMRRLADARRKTGSRTSVHVYFHKYRHNLHELAAMKAFTEDLGFDFLATWAFYMPLENLIRYAEGTLPEHDRTFADESIVPSVGTALDLMRPHRDTACMLIDQLVLDFRGNVILCCAVYDLAKNTIGPYLDGDWATFQRLKYGHRTCEKCTHHGAHVLGTYFGTPSLVTAMEHLAEEELAVAPTPSPTRVALPVLDAVAAGGGAP